MINDQPPAGTSGTWASFGENMQRSYRDYFADIQKQLGGALAKKQGMEELRKKYWAQIWDMRKSGIEDALSRVQSRPSVAEGVISQGQVELDANLDKIRQQSQASAIQRGLGSSTVDMARARGPQNEATRGFTSWAAGLRADEQRQKQADTRALQDQLGMLPAGRAEDYMNFMTQFGEPTFDPTAYMNMRMTQMSSQPWGMMGQPIGHYMGDSGGMLESLGTAAIGGGTAGLVAALV